MLGEHPYLYCEHEPVNAVDPSGYRIEDFGQLEKGADLIAKGVALIGGGTLLPLPPVAGVGMAVVGIGVSIVGAVAIGDWIADHLLPPPVTYIPAPSEDELKKYRDEIEKGWRNGTILLPPGWHRQPLPVPPFDPRHHH